MIRIDSHQHFWTLARGDYGWLTPEFGPIYRDFGPEDLSPLMAARGVKKTILVQAAPTEAETEFLLEIATNTDFVLGVVGWVDFEAPDAGHKIASLARHPKLLGLRPMIQDIEDINWMLRETQQAAIESLIKHDLTFDALTLPKHLPNLLQLLKRHPDLRCVIDHGSKPEIRNDGLQSWAHDMQRIAAETGAFCKLSGLVTEASDDWQPDDLKPYVDLLLDAFGPDRLMWGSDWPVCTLAASYDDWAGACDALLGHLDASDQRKIYETTAKHAYKLESET